MNHNIKTNENIVCRSCPCIGISSSKDNAMLFVRENKKHMVIDVESREVLFETNENAGGFFCGSKYLLLSISPKSNSFHLRDIAVVDLETKSEVYRERINKIIGTKYQDSFYLIHKNRLIIGANDLHKWKSEMLFVDLTDKSIKKALFNFRIFNPVEKGNILFFNDYNNVYSIDLDAENPADTFKDVSAECLRDVILNDGTPDFEAKEVLVFWIDRASRAYEIFCYDFENKKKICMCEQEFPFDEFSLDNYTTLWCINNKPVALCGCLDVENETKTINLYALKNKKIIGTFVFDEVSVRFVSDRIGKEILLTDDPYLKRKERYQIRFGVIPCSNSEYIRMFCNKCAIVIKTPSEILDVLKDEYLSATN